ncbi:thioredoxin domain-containing protein [Algihabitans albus]|uniref:thioredoxin domain-containing protein n=1 Tax=Algihabitans albus TaxID=2164067 RepID=UPI000E5C64DB|nr:thioredoxin domain-containing protein [Algihabitans albus]
MPESHASTNRLAAETSPYLLQHADNPVDWYPWGEAAFAKAKADGKPILLSVGYAACHWCHVMAHESFESSDIAGLMNRLFVNVKVDREERPDVDQIYQQALALMNQQGGWPLTMFLTPDGAPFWGGTYFPPDARWGRPGFPEILERIAQVYEEKPDDIDKNVVALKEALGKLSTPEAGGQVLPEAGLQAAQRLARQIDPFHGGLGEAPKFPQPAILKLLWQAWLRSGQAPLRQGVELTLLHMSQGGLYDHLGGGYARYATDEAWLVPHFEKMLYDNAQILDLLTWGAQDASEPWKRALFAQRARETVDWLLREMLAPAGPGGPPSGAFAATYDADSEGEEGKFYVWSAAEVQEVLGAEASVFAEWYDVTTDGNWEATNILNRLNRLEPGDPATEAKLAEQRARLFARRADRIWPGWDDKVLADWNGLMIAALARAAPVFGEDDWLTAAERAFAFVVEEMQEDGRLRHSWRHGRLKHPATLDDYAFMSDAALALFEATGKRVYLSQAETWVAVLDRHYWDTENGGYFLTADDTERLLVRPKHAHDNATPSGNGVILQVLARLWHLTGQASYRERADATVAAFSGELARLFSAMASFLLGSELLHDAPQLVVVGDQSDPKMREFLASRWQISAPTLVIQTVTSEENLPRLHPAYGKSRVDGEPAAYLCRGTSCSLPIVDAQDLKDSLRELRG